MVPRVVGLQYRRTIIVIIAVSRTATLGTMIPTIRATGILASVVFDAGAGVLLVVTLSVVSVLVCVVAGLLIVVVDAGLTSVVLEVTADGGVAVSGLPSASIANPTAVASGKFCSISADKIVFNDRSE